MASYVFLFFFPVFEQISSCTCSLSPANRLPQYLHSSKSSLAIADFGPCLADGLAVEGAFGVADVADWALLMMWEGVLLGVCLLWDCCAGEVVDDEDFDGDAAGLTTVLLTIG